MFDDSELSDGVSAATVCNKFNNFFSTIGEKIQAQKPQCPPISLPAANRSMPLPETLALKKIRIIDKLDLNAPW